MNSLLEERIDDWGNIQCLMRIPIDECSYPCFPMNEEEAIAHYKDRPTSTIPPVVAIDKKLREDGKYGIVVGCWYHVALKARGEKEIMVWVITGKTVNNKK